MCQIWGYSKKQHHNKQKKKKNLRTQSSKVKLINSRMIKEAGNGKKRVEEKKEETEK